MASPEHSLPQQRSPRLSVKIVEAYFWACMAYFVWSAKVYIPGLARPVLEFGDGVSWITRREMAGDDRILSQLVSQYLQSLQYLSNLITLSSVSKLPSLAARHFCKDFVTSCTSCSLHDKCRVNRKHFLWLLLLCSLSIMTQSAGFEKETTRNKKRRKQGGVQNRRRLWSAWPHFSIKRTILQVRLQSMKRTIGLPFGPFLWFMHRCSFWEGWKSPFIISPSSRTGRYHKISIGVSWQKLLSIWFPLYQFFVCRDIQSS